MLVQHILEFAVLQSRFQSSSIKLSKH